MNMKKILVLVSCMVLIAGLSVGATLAYLTDDDSVKNTFTVGNVEIILDEGDVWELNADGSYEAGATYDNLGLHKDNGVTRVEGNSYKLLPGMTYDKDPQVHVKKTSEKCYVRMQVTVSDMVNLKAALPEAKYYGNDGVFLLQNLVSGWNNSVWAYQSYKPGEGNKGVYEFWYTSIVDPSTATGEYLDVPALFTKLVIPGEIDNDNLAKLNAIEIDVVAHAIQSAGFVSAADAWEKFE